MTGVLQIAPRRAILYENVAGRDAVRDAGVSE